MPIAVADLQLTSGYSAPAFDALDFSLETLQAVSVTLPAAGALTLAAGALTPQVEASQDVSVVLPTAGALHLDGGAFLGVYGDVGIQLPAKPLYLAAGAVSVTVEAPPSPVVVTLPAAGTLTLTAGTVAGQPVTGVDVVLPTAGALQLAAGTLTPAVIPLADVSVALPTVGVLWPEAGAVTVEVVPLAPVSLSLGAPGSIWLSAGSVAVAVTADVAVTLAPAAIMWLAEGVIVTGQGVLVATDERTFVAAARPFLFTAGVRNDPVYLGHGEVHRVTWDFTHVLAEGETIRSAMAHGERFGTGEAEAGIVLSSIEVSGPSVTALVTVDASVAAEHRYSLECEVLTAWGTQVQARDHMGRSLRAIVRNGEVRGAWRWTLGVGAKQVFALDFRRLIPEGAAIVGSPSIAIRSRDGSVPTELTESSLSLSNGVAVFLLEADDAIQAGDYALVGQVDLDTGERKQARDPHGRPVRVSVRH